MNFIKTQNIQSRKEYFDILCKYIPNVSADETFYTIQEGNKSRIIYSEVCFEIRTYLEKTGIFPEKVILHKNFHFR